MTIFVDNNIPSRIAFGQSKNPLDSEAINNIWYLPTVIFMTSRKCKQEAYAMPGKVEREKLMEVYKKIEIVPTRPTLSYGHVAFGGGHSTQDVARTKLRQLFHSKPKKGFKANPQNDADHIFEAMEAGCDCFLTVDRKSILNVYQSKRHAVKSLIGKMEIVDPPNLLNRLIKMGVA